MFTLKVISNQFVLKTTVMFQLQLQSVTVRQQK